MIETLALLSYFFVELLLFINLFICCCWHVFFAFLIAIAAIEKCYYKSYFEILAVHIAEAAAAIIS
jgi:hypothetical protein